EQQCYEGNESRRYGDSKRCYGCRYHHGTASTRGGGTERQEHATPLAPASYSTHHARPTAPGRSSSPHADTHPSPASRYPSGRDPGPVPTSALPLRGRSGRARRLEPTIRGQQHTESLDEVVVVLHNQDSPPSPFWQERPGE